MMYSAVQTGPNIQFGGLKDGLTRLAYHSPGNVKRPMASPPPTVRARKNRSDPQLPAIAVSPRCDCCVMIYPLSITETKNPSVPVSLGVSVTPCLDR